MRILICDDEVRYISDLQGHIENYMNNHSIAYQIDTTTSPKEITESDAIYDLVFLDIKMPVFDGIDLAYELKQRNSKVVIFFVTAFNEYQDVAMDLQVFRFFEKPFDVNRLYSSLDKAMEYIDGAYVDVFIYSNKEHKRILVDDIVYIENKNRKSYIYTNDGEFVVRESIEEWNEKLPTTFFYQVHKSFLINLHYITKYTYEEIYLNEKIRIPIATRKQVEFHKSWFRYLKRR
jgi:two-component system LytT family response regulator